MQFGDRTRFRSENEYDCFMSDRVKLLPDSVANQIAAGEVIQRPAAVIKELVENAVDAGASEISITVKEAGKTLIQVVDNGIGMSETDARMAFERHATSKIRSADDLFSLHTMGFRGEALPSICAISDVEIKTRTEDSPVGTRLVIKGSEVTEQEPCVCNVGTVISVRSLFFNTPARRRFLKSDNVELANILREFERLALVNNNIRMSIDTGTRHIDLRPGSLRIRIEEIWKNNLNGDQLLPVDVDTSLVKIEGYVSRPEFARRRNPLQYLIVNGRNMRHPYFHKAIMSCYESLIATDTQPCYFLKFTVDPSTIDVNIHPTKNEIKFEYEQQIWPILVSAVKTSLGKFSAVPSIDFSVDAIPLSPLRDGEIATPPKMDYNGGYNPFSSGSPSRATKVDSNWDKLYSGFLNQEREDSPADNSTDADFFDESKDDKTLLSDLKTPHDPAPMCVQFGMKYIVTPSRDGLIIIDQHRAHLKVLYEEFLSRSSRMEVVSQSVMFPEVVSLDEAQQEALREVGEDMRKMGLTLEHDEDSLWKITTVPQAFRDSEVKDIVMRILDSVSEDSANYGKDAPGMPVSIIERVALVMARSSAIRKGVRLSVDEMENLIGRLFSLPEPSLTPMGRKIFITLNDSDIANMLG